MRCLTLQRFFGLVVFTLGFAELVLLFVLFVLAVLCIVLAFFVVLLFVFVLGFQDDELVMDKLVQAAGRERTPCPINEAVDTISDAILAT